MGAWGAEGDYGVIYYIFYVQYNVEEEGWRFLLRFVGSSHFSVAPAGRGQEDLQDPGPLAGQGTVLREQRDVQSNTKHLSSWHSEDDEAEHQSREEPGHGSGSLLEPLQRSLGEGPAANLSDTQPCFWSVGGRWRTWREPSRHNRKQQLTTAPVRHLQVTGFVSL